MDEARSVMPRQSMILGFLDFRASHSISLSGSKISEILGELCTSLQWRFSIFFTVGARSIILVKVNDIFRSRLDIKTCP